jgi:hypothetical protein
MSEKDIYVMGWEFYLGREEEAKRIISAERIDKEDADSYSYLAPCARLHFLDEKINSIYEIEKGKETFKDDHLSESESQFTYFDSPSNKLMLLDIDNEKQLHKLGGTPPEGFKTPRHEKINAPFQYIGFISSADPFFSWLPFEQLHVAYPIHCGVMALYFDYSNPLEPKIIETKDLDDISYSFQEINRDTELIFEERFLKSFVFNKKVNTSYIGFGGIPSWVQYPHFPLCPVSGKPMKFVCQLESISEIKLAKSSLPIPEDNWSLNSYVGCMDFWGCGYFYLFMNPEEKTVCMFIQNT